MLNIKKCYGSYAYRDSCAVLLSVNVHVIEIILFEKFHLLLWIKSYTLAFNCYY